MMELRKLVAKLLREIANKVDVGNTEMTPEEAMHIVSMLTHEPMSKEKSCAFLNVSRSKFDDLVKKAELPQGRKRVGFKEKVWYKDELEECKEYLKKN